MGFKTVRKLCKITEAGQLFLKKAMEKLSLSERLMTGS
ncbi:hypothetical protein ADIARSV_1938 [Arcticibacter svalbardensis MN12-7]|uniref:Uncharacterized protein n=1 Tax=Arcticibacter svalbardensis MN12-7 TaxID=1150600 RepID=R9H0Y9_9SPHI|nr:hypothetical protein ADIARSV_1938 [Arcticibacter svalbardensis MN12-7]